MLQMLIYKVKEKMITIKIYKLRDWLFLMLEFELLIFLFGFSYYWNRDELLIWGFRSKNL